MVNETFDRYLRKMDTLSPQERTNWRRWKIEMLKEVDAVKEVGPPKLASKLRQGARDLKALNVVLKEADKNLGIVAIRGDIYNAMVREHLNSTTYARVVRFPHEVIWKRLENIIKLYTPRIPLSLKKEWLEHANSAKEPCPFYVIPKIHKPTLGSRPITAQHSYMLAPLSRALAKVLQPISDGFMEIAKDSKMVVQQLETKHVKEPVVFLTYDVEQLYPSIDLRDAINTLGSKLPIMDEDRGFWKKVLQLIMYNNYVTWNDQVFRQMKGTATGTQVAPPFANLYLLFKFRMVFDEEAPGIIYQSRYIDDGLVMVNDVETAERIASKLNDATNLRLTFQIDNHCATYLDLDVYKGKRFREEGYVDIKTHIKGTNKFLYLPAISDHPGKHKAAVIKGEAIRCLRNSTDKIEWLKTMDLVFKGLLARGYDPKMIRTKWKQVKFEDRDSYVMESSEATKPPGTSIIVPFHPKAKAIWRVLLAKRPIRSTMIARRFGRLTKKQQSILEDWPPKIIYKDFRKVGRMVISAKEVWKLQRRDTRTHAGPSRIVDSVSTAQPN